MFKCVLIIYIRTSLIKPCIPWSWYDSGTTLFRQKFPKVPLEWHLWWNSQYVDFRVDTRTSVAAVLRTWSCSFLRNSPVQSFLSPSSVERCQCEIRWNSRENVFRYWIVLKLCWIVLMFIRRMSGLARPWRREFGALYSHELSPLPGSKLCLWGSGQFLESRLPGRNDN